MDGTVKDSSPEPESTREAIILTPAGHVNALSAVHLLKAPSCMSAREPVPVTDESEEHELRAYEPRDVIPVRSAETSPDCAKEYDPYSVQPFSFGSDVSAVQPKNVKSGRRLVSGMFLTSVSAGQSRNTASPIAVMFFESVTDVRAVHFLKAESPTEVTVSGRTTVSAVVLPANAFEATAFTVYTVPPMV